MRGIFFALEREKIPLILYAKNTARHHAAQVAAGIKILSIDHTENLRQLRDKLPPATVLQGNLDPALMTSTPRQVAAGTRELLQQMSTTTGHILNLGHGITPDAKIENVETLVATTRAWQNPS